MSKYSNLWTDGERYIKSDDSPGINYVAVFAPYRVRGAGYIPYEPKDGSAAWVKAVNRHMADVARGNFERGAR